MATETGHAPPAREGEPGQALHRGQPRRRLPLHEDDHAAEAARLAARPEPAGERGPGDRRARPRADRAHGRDHARSAPRLRADRWPSRPCRPRPCARRLPPRPGSTTRGRAPRTARRCARPGCTTATRSSAAAAAGPPGTRRSTRATTAPSGTSTARTRSAFRMFRRTGHARLRADRELRGQRRAARRVQGLRGQRRPQGPLLDGGAAPGLGLAAPRDGALPLARDLALPAAAGCSRTRA